MSRDTYVVRPFRLASLDDLPWGNEEFDAFVVVLDPSALGESGAVFRTLVALNVDWVETLGPGAETLHDQIDAASVAIGRQTAVGDGSPMTAWHEDLIEMDQVVEYVRGGGHGASERKLVLVVGDVNRLRTAIENQG